jgi:hypothetical protein
MKKSANFSASSQSFVDCGLGFSALVPVNYENNKEFFLITFGI